MITEKRLEILQQMYALYDKIMQARIDILEAEKMILLKESQLAVEEERERICKVLHERLGFETAELVSAAIRAEPNKQYTDGEM